jgi:hypothetical protein
MLVQGLVALAYCWLAWDRGQECYDRIRVGMSAADAIAILEERGYSVVDGDGNSREWVVVYKRHKTEPRIVLIFGRDNRLTNKERDFRLAYLL